MRNFFIPALLIALFSQGSRAEIVDLNVLNVVVKTLASKEEGHALDEEDIPTITAGLFNRDELYYEAAVSDSNPDDGIDGFRFHTESGKTMYLSVNTQANSLDVTYSDGENFTLLPGYTLVKFRDFSNQFRLNNFKAEFILSGNSEIYTPLASVDEDGIPAISLNINTSQSVEVPEQHLTLQGVDGIQLDESVDNYLSLDLSENPISGDSISIFDVNSEDSILISGDNQVQWNIEHGTASVSTLSSRNPIATITYNELMITNTSSALTLRSTPAINACISETASEFSVNTNHLQDCDAERFSSEGDFYIEVGRGKVSDAAIMPNESGGGSLHWGFLLLLTSLLWRRFTHHTPNSQP